MSYNQFPPPGPGGQQPWSPGGQPAPPQQSDQPAYLNPLYAPQNTGSHQKTSPVNHVKKTLSILAGRPSGPQHAQYQPQQQPIYQQQHSPVPNMYTPQASSPAGGWQPPAAQVQPPQMHPPFGGPQPSGTFSPPPQHMGVPPPHLQNQQPQMFSPQPQQQPMHSPPPMHSPTAMHHSPPVQTPPVQHQPQQQHQPHHQHQQSQPFVPSQQAAQGPPPAYQPPPPGSQFGPGGAAGVDGPHKQQNQYGTPSAGGSPFTPPTGGFAPPAQQHGASSSHQQQQQPSHQHQHQQQPHHPAGPIEWGSLVDMSVEPPRASEKLRNLVEGIAEYILDEDTPDNSPCVVLSPAKLAAYYGSVAAYNSNYRQFFESSTKKPIRLTQFYDSLSCEYLLIPSTIPSAPPVPGLTLAGFERFSLLQILLFPDLSAQLYSAILTSQKRTIKDPSTGHEYPKHGPPRTSLPSQPHQATFARFGSLWQNTINTPAEAPDADSELDVLKRRIQELQRENDFKASEAKNAREDAASQKATVQQLHTEIGNLRKTIHEKDSAVNSSAGEISRLQAALNARDDEIAALRRTIQEKDAALQRTQHDVDESVRRVATERDNARHQLQIKDTELANVTRKMQELQNEVSSLHNARTIRETELSALHSRVRDLEREIQKSNHRFEEADQDAAKLRTERTQLVNELAEVKKVLAKRESELHQLKAKQALPGSSTSGGGGGGMLAGLFGTGGGSNGSGNGAASPPPNGTPSPAPYVKREYGRGDRQAMSPSPAAMSPQQRRPTGLDGKPKAPLPYPED